MDSTTIKMMAQTAFNNQVAFKLRSDSIQNAVNERAEFLLLRHDIVLILMVLIPSIALVASVCIYIKGRNQSA